MDPTVAAIGLIEFAAIVSVAIVVSRRSLREKDLPRVAMLSAGIFVAQMLNFPIGGGTTGHLVGGALFAIMVGPTFAIIGMTVILLIQALMFGDGGITAFGLNALNMAIIAPLVGWGVFNLMKPLVGRTGRIGQGVSVGTAAWASVFVAAAACAAEMAVSYAISGGTYGIAATVSVPAMLGFHAVIGVGEAAISAGVVTYLEHVSPETFSRRAAANPSSSGRKGVLRSTTLRASGAVLLVLALALPFYFLYAAEGRDGLEQTMEDAGVTEGAQLANSPFTYGQNYFGALFSGIIGFVAVSLAMTGIMRALDGRRAADEM